MSNPKEENSFIEEFKKFLQFLQNLWSILAGISVFFPLSNSFAKIALAQWPEGGLVFFPAELFSTISSLACLFIILYTFGHRHQIGRNRRTIQKKAMFSFLAGVIALIFYLIVYFAVKEDFWYNYCGVQGGDFIRVFGDIVLLIAYSIFFVLMTRAFMLLGMLEYFRGESHTAQPRH